MNIGNLKFFQGIKGGIGIIENQTAVRYRPQAPPFHSCRIKHGLQKIHGADISFGSNAPAVLNSYFFLAAFYLGQNHPDTFHNVHRFKSGDYGSPIGFSDHFVSIGANHGADMAGAKEAIDIQQGIGKQSSRAPEAQSYARKRRKSF